MPKKIKIEGTKAQLMAIIRLTDDVSATLGYHDNKEQIRNIKLIDRMLKSNGYRRQYN